MYQATTREPRLCHLVPSTQEEGIRFWSNQLLMVVTEAGRVAHELVRVAKSLHLLRMTLANSDRNPRTLRLLADA